MMFPKDTEFRSEALRRSSRGRPCSIRVAGVCTGGGEDTVWAHSNRHRHGKGGSRKAHDCFGADACQACHDFVDGRSYINQATQELRDEYMQKGMEASLLARFRDGTLKVNAARR